MRPGRASYFTPQANLYLEQICEALTACGVPYRLDPRLVRGLDYYSHVVFEFVASEASELGGPSTVLAGGFYTGLLELIGGEKARHFAFPCRGWAAGPRETRAAPPRGRRKNKNKPCSPSCRLERRRPTKGRRWRTTQTLLACLNTPRRPNWPRSSAGRASPLRLVLTEGSLKKNLRRAAAPPTRAVLLLWDDGQQTEITEITVKNLDTGTQETVARDGLCAYLRQHYGACLRPVSSGGS